MNRSLVLAVVAAPFAFAWGCSSSSSTPPIDVADAAALHDAALATDSSSSSSLDASRTTDGSSVVDSSSSSDSSSSDSSSSSDGSTTKDSGPSAGCQTYCTSIMANCTAANQQYTSMTECLASCGAMPPGASSDMSGDTLGCRTYHAGAAQADPGVHCVHAGPGGNGVCGDDCDGYCQLAMTYCTATSGGQVYATLNDCKTACAAFPSTVKLDVNDTSLPSQYEVACLLYHAQAATTAPTTHCPHLLPNNGGQGSAACNQ